jgi:hypothetical protein
MTETLVQMYERLQIKPRTEQRREAQTKRIVAIALTARASLATGAAYVV